MSKNKDKDKAKEEEEKKLTSAKDLDSEEVKDKDMNKDKEPKIKYLKDKPSTSKEDVTNEDKVKVKDTEVKVQSLNNVIDNERLMKDIAIKTEIDDKLMKNELEQQLAQAKGKFPIDNFPTEEKPGYFTDRKYDYVSQGIPKVFKIEIVHNDKLNGGGLPLIGFDLGDTAPYIQESMVKMSDKLLYMRFIFDPENLRAIVELTPDAKGLIKHQVTIEKNLYSSIQQQTWIASRLKSFIQLATLPNTLIAQTDKWTTDTLVSSSTYLSGVLDVNETKVFSNSGLHIIWAGASTPLQWFRNHLFNMFREFPVRFSEANSVANVVGEKIRCTVRTAVDQVAADIHNRMHEYWVANQMTPENYIAQLEQSNYYAQGITSLDHHYGRDNRPYQPTRIDCRNYLFRWMIDQKYRDSELAYITKQIEQQGMYYFSLPSDLLGSITAANPNVTLAVFQNFEKMLAGGMSMEQLVILDSAPYVFDFVFSSPINDDIHSNLLTVYAWLMFSSMFPQLISRNPARFAYNLMQLLYRIIPTEVNQFERDFGWRVILDANDVYVREDGFGLCDTTLEEYQNGMSCSLIHGVDIPGGRYQIFAQLRALIMTTPTYPIHLIRKQNAGAPHMTNEYFGVVSHQYLPNIQNISVRTPLVMRLNQVYALMATIRTTAIRQAFVQKDVAATQAALINGIFNKIFAYMGTVGALFAGSVARQQEVVLNSTQVPLSVPLVHGRGYNQPWRFAPLTEQAALEHGTNLPVRTITVDPTCALKIVVLCSGMHPRFTPTMTGEAKVNRVVAPMKLVEIAAHNRLQYENASSLVETYFLFNSVLHCEAPDSPLRPFAPTLVPILSVTNSYGILEMIDQYNKTNLKQLLLEITDSERATDPRIRNGVIGIVSRFNQVQGIPETMFGVRFFVPTDLCVQKMNISARLLLRLNDPLYRRVQGLRIGIEEQEVLNPFIPYNSPYDYDNPIPITLNDLITAGDQVRRMIAVRVNGRPYTSALHPDLNNRVFQLPSLAGVPPAHLEWFKRGILAKRIAIVLTDIYVKYTIRTLTDKNSPVYNWEAFSPMWSDVTQVLAGGEFNVEFIDSTKAYFQIVGQPVQSAFIVLFLPSVPLISDYLAECIFNDGAPPADVRLPVPANWSFGNMVNGHNLIPGTNIRKDTYQIINYNNELKVITGGGGPKDNPDSFKLPEVSIKDPWVQEPPIN